VIELDRIMNPVD